jgi:hypothetical protein
VSFADADGRVVPSHERARSVALLLLGHAAVAWNEEQLFRGYGFTVLDDAVGRTAALGILIPLFGIYHTLKPWRIVMYAIFGLFLNLLRLHTGSLWVGLGYHWVWNSMQTAVFGPPGGLPSLKTMRVHGPEAWIGRLGHPEPGWLVILIQVAGIVGIGLSRWYRKRQAARSLSA